MSFYSIYETFSLLISKEFFMTNYTKCTLKLREIFSETDALEFQIQNHSSFVIELLFTRWKVLENLQEIREKLRGKHKNVDTTSLSTSVDA